MMYRYNLCRYAEITIMKNTEEVEMKKTIMTAAIIATINGTTVSAFGATVAGTPATDKEVANGFRLGTCGGQASNNPSESKCRSSVVTEDGDILLKNNNGRDADGYVHTGDSLSYDDTELREEIDTVNKEDMRTKSGKVDGDTLTLRVEDMAKSQGRDYIYGKDVDIDVSSLNQADEVDANSSRITSETVARTTEDTRLDSRITSETDALITEDARLDSRITSETDARETEDTRLDSRITSETDARETEDTRLDSRITSETDARETEDTRLGDRISTETIDRETGDARLGDRITSETDAREAGDARLGDRITSETDAREAGDDLLNSRITSETDRLDGRLDVQGDRIDTNTTDISSLESYTTDVESESIARDTILSETIQSETNTRIVMDDKLQAQIDTSNQRSAASMDYAVDNRKRIVSTNMRIDLLAEDVETNSSRIDYLEQNMDHLKSEIYSGLAGIAAMGAIPNATVGKTAIGFGYGNYGGEDAAAVGLSHRTEDGKHSVTLSTTITNDETGVGVGYSFSF